MKVLNTILAGLLIFSAASLSAQTDRKEVRKGNREYRKGEYKEAEIDYRKALVKDSLSFAANFNLACDLYRQKQYDEAGKSMKKIENQVDAKGYGADYHYNAGDIALAKKDYQGAVDAFEKALLLRPEDMDAKENYVYAKMMLQNQQNQQGQNDQNQDNQDQDNQDQDQQNQNNQNQNNQDQNNQDQQDQQDQNRDNQNDRNQNDRNQDSQNQDQQNQQDSKISPQAAQQMLQAIQAREKETQDKVNREKAAALKARQKEKNW